MKRVPMFPRSRVIVMIVGFGLVVSARRSACWCASDKKPKPKPQGLTVLDGAWRLVKSKDPRTGQMPGCHLVLR